MRWWQRDVRLMDFDDCLKSRNSCNCSPAHKTQPSENTDKKAEKADNALHFSATGKVSRKTTRN